MKKQSTVPIGVPDWVRRAFRAVAAQRDVSVQSLVAPVVIDLAIRLGGNPEAPQEDGPTDRVPPAPGTAGALPPPREDGDA